MHTLGHISPFAAANNAQGRCIAYACIYINTRLHMEKSRYRGTRA